MLEMRRNLAVGAFVLVGLLALGSLIVLFGKFPTWFVRGKTYAVHIHFTDVSGIRSGNEVTVAGCRIGRVEDINFINPADLRVGVDVLVAIDEPYKIPKGSTASTTTPMFGTGRPPIVITPPAKYEGFLEPGDIIARAKSQNPMDSIIPQSVVKNFDDTAQQIGAAAKALTPVLNELQDLLAKRSPAEVDDHPGGPQGNISSAVARLDAAFKHFNDVLGDEQVKSQLRETVTNVHDMSEKGQTIMADIEKGVTDGREMISDARKTISKVDDALSNLNGRVDDVARSTMGSLEKADEFLGYLNVIGRQVSSGEGNVGHLFMDNKLYEAFLFSLEKVSATVDDFRALILDWQAHGMKTRF